MTYQRIGVLGGGAWGSALAQTCARAGRDVTLWEFDAEHAAYLAKERESRFLPGIKLDDKITVTNTLTDAARNDAILLVVPAQALRSSIRSLANDLSAQTPLIACAKGIEHGTQKFMTDIIAECAPDAVAGILSGPSFAIDVARGLPTAVTIATPDANIAETLAQLQSVHASIDKYLQQARILQHSLMPRRSVQFGKSRVSVMLQSCGHVGGDLAGMFGAATGDFGMFSLDVSGHGITSAMMTARLGSYLSSVHFDQNLGVAPDGKGFVLRPPVEVAQQMNARLVADVVIEEYFTMAYGTVDLATGALKLVQAGHPHPLLLRADGSTAFLGDGGLPIGLLPDAPFTQIELTLAPGDRVLLYSDGFTEARVRDGVMLDTDGLLELVRHCQPHQYGCEFLDDLFWSLTEIMSPEHGMEDDVSAALFEFNGS